MAAASPCECRNVMSPYVALVGVFAFMLLVATIGAVDILRGRRTAKHAGPERAM